MTKSKIIALTALITFAFGIGAISSAVADEAENEAIIVRNSVEIWHKGNVAVIDEIVSKDYVRYMPGGVEFRGREGCKQHVLGFIPSLPDYYTSTDIMISKGDYVVVRYLGSGTHTGEGGILGPPTGKKMTLTAIVIHRLAGGMMVEDWVELDNVSIMGQLGYKLVPPGGE